MKKDKRCDWCGEIMKNARANKRFCNAKHKNHRHAYDDHIDTANIVLTVAYKGDVDAALERSPKFNHLRGQVMDLIQKHDGNPILIYQFPGIKAPNKSSTKKMQKGGIARTFDEYTFEVLNELSKRYSLTGMQEDRMLEQYADQIFMEWEDGYSPSETALGIAPKGSTLDFFT